MDIACLWARDSDNHELHVRRDLASAQQAIKRSDQKGNILVAAMLRDAEQKALSVPAGKGRRHARDWFGFDAVIYPQRLLPYSLGEVLPQTKKGNFGDACNCVDIAKTLPKDDAVENELRKAEVHRYLIGVQIVQRNDRWARERCRIHRHGIRQMNHIGLKLSC